MSKPTTGIFPIENGKLITPLDCSGLQLLNLDESNLSGGGGGGGGGGGNDTGTTTAILKGDGNHGFADALADTDYASPASVAAKEDTTTHNADVAILTANIATLTTSVAGKADAATVTAALALKADASALTSYITSNDAAVALKANSSDVTTALAAKADASATTTALAGKEPLLPTTLNDSYILARHNAGSGGGWFFVDPVSLGTTNQSFVDGQSFTNTNFDSASAQFNSGDIGKTITGTNIPAATTISSITSATRVVLSQATTGTGSSLSFTIFNRLTVAGGGGTVTSVSVNNDAANTLFGTSVSNPTTSATIGITMSTTVPANAVWGNPNPFLGAATFLTPAQQRISLGGTTVGQALFQLTNPNAISYARINADNTVTSRTPSQTLSDLGAENSLTFSNPLARNVNAISIPAATDSVAGHLTAADHTSFAAKVPGTRLLTMTTPLLIDGVASASLASDRTISMPAATDSVSGYLTGTDHASFVAKPPNSRTISTTAPLTGGGDLSANRTFAIPRVTSVPAVDGYLAASDFTNFTSNLPKSENAPAGGTYNVTVGSPVITRIQLTTQLTSTLTINLPPASGYNTSPGAPSFIEIVDLVAPLPGTATANFGIVLSRSALSGNTDLVDNLSLVSLAKGIGYVRINSNGVNRWNTTKYYVDSFKDGTTPSKIVTLNVGNQDPNIPGRLTLGVGESVTVNPTDVQNVLGVVQDITTTGFVVKAQLHPTDLLPVFYDVGSVGVTTAPGTYAVTDTSPGSYDSVRIAGPLGGNITLRWPTSSRYSPGESVYLYDFSGSLVPGSAAVTIVPAVASSDKFNGADQFIFDEAFGRKIFTSDGAGNWTVSLTKTSVVPYKVLTVGASNTFTLSSDKNTVKQNARITLLNGANNLSVLNAFDGMSIEIILIQPSSGAAGTLGLPIPSYVSGTGGGVLTLTATNSAIDKVRGTFDTGIFYWDAPLVNYTTTPIPNAPSGIATSGVTASKVVITWTDNSANETGFSLERQDVTHSIPYAEITTVAAGVVTYTDNGVLPGTQYNYRVRAFNAGGASTYNGPATATTLSGGPTADFLEVHFNEGSGSSAACQVPSGMNLSLRYATDWVSPGASGAGKAFQGTAGMQQTTGNPGTVPQGTPGTSGYTYKVNAYKTVGGWHNANGTFATTTGPAVVTGTNFNRITWNAVTGADYYVVYRTAVPVGSGLTVGPLTPTAGGTFTALTIDDVSGSAALTTTGTTPTDIGTATDSHDVSCPTPIDFTSTNQMSCTFWIKGTLLTAATDNIISAGAGNSVFRISATGNTQGVNKFQVSFPTATGTKTGTVPANISSTGAGGSASLVNAGTDWHLVCVTMDNSQNTHLGTEIKVYYDAAGGTGTAQTTTYSGVGTGSKFFAAGAPVIGSNHFSGALDDVRIYNHILTTGEMGSLFSGGAQ